jgi:formate-dependent nitrite reductase cytochrome c552 subunit|tara:strand:- start:194 stop:445 length:252 start_codon:yes stop_codon:yes gene_type:complete
MIGYIILGIISLTLSYVVFNLTRKVERLETWVEDYAQRIQDTKQVLDELDNKGTFQADDEIGVVFTAIKEAVDEINEITETEL